MVAYSGGLMLGEYFVPIDHLEYLLKKKKGGKPIGDERWHAMLLAGGEGRTKVIEHIESNFRGTAEMLRRTWRWHGSTAVHLWQLPWLKDLSESNIKKLVNAALKIKPGPTLVEVEGELDEAGESRILNVQLRDDILFMTVRRAAVRRSVFEGEPQEMFSQADTEVALDLTRPKAILEVYATHATAKAAAESFLTLGLGQVVPKGGKSAKAMKERAAVLSPVAFTEEMAQGVAKKLKMKQANMVGLDALNECGELSMSGKQKGNLLEALGEFDRAKRQTASSNYIREYRMTHELDDGFKHDSMVQFYMKSKHPHLKFKTKTSRPAVHTVVSEICERAT